MSLAPLPSARRPERMLAGPGMPARRLPSARLLARRRLMIQATKLALPAVALALLASLAVWPEMQSQMGQAEAAARAVGKLQGATVIGARYRSLDERGRPYTLTAAAARQVGENRVDLTDPKGDMTLENGTWVMLQARQGVYRQHDSALDLSRDVTLYRDDGTTMHTQSAALDLKSGAAAGAEPVHAEGPFGRLDSAGGFTATDKGEQIFFAGRSHLLLNGANGP
ncbi:MAG: LPS export ABC transporter periplasmic protein LptC [Acetobacteraceae bacterium]